MEYRNLEYSALGGATNLGQLLAVRWRGGARSPNPPGAQGRGDMQKSSIKLQMFCYGQKMRKVPLTHLRVPCLGPAHHLGQFPALQSLV